MQAQEYWVHDLDPVAIHLWGDFGIRYYGLAYGLGFIIGFFVLYWFYKKGKSPLNREQLVDVILIIVIGVIAGGRVGFMLLYNLDGFLKDPLILFKIWEGGMASHGGFVGVAVAAWIISRKYPVGYLQLGDLLAVAATPGITLGRIANFINGELWGKVTDVPWAVIFPTADMQPRHPSQLYESLGEGLIPFIYMMVRVSTSNVLQRPGRLLGEFFILYSVGRAAAAYFKVPDQPMIMGQAPGVFYSFFLALAGAYLIYRDIRNRKKTTGKGQTTN
jgi:phosphatidylglycerol:prolipoprotein diacylglycerol transferase